MRALIVEDEPKMAGLICRGIAPEGFTGVVATSGEHALLQLEDGIFDVVVLDVGLPGISGFETCKLMRARGDWTPTLMLTARSDLDARVAGLNSGADDYLAKPFALAELIARLKAVTRRSGAATGDVLEAGDLRLDVSERRVWRGDAEIMLAPQEFALLHAFMRHPNQLLNRSQLLQHAWQYDYTGTSNVVDVYVRYLRRKIDVPFERHSIQTVRGLGYRLTDA